MEMARSLTQPTRSRGGDANKNHNQTSRSQKTEKTQPNSRNSKKKPEETKSKKPEEQKKKKKDKSRGGSRSKVLAEILDLLLMEFSLFCFLFDTPSSVGSVLRV
ncbi:unnamed protein product [Rhizophagus irregularis]|nr:unnamed protein product [Rhizophagus irregularis]